MSSHLQEQRDMYEVGDTFAYEVRYSDKRPSKIMTGEVKGVVRGGVRGQLHGEKEARIFRFNEISLISKKRPRRILVDMVDQAPKSGPYEPSNGQKDKSLRAPLMEQGLRRIMEPPPPPPEPPPPPVVVAPPSPPVPEPVAPPPPPATGGRSALDAWLEMGQDVVPELEREMKLLETSIEEMQFEISDLEDRIAEKQLRIKKLEAHLKVAKGLHAEPKKRGRPASRRAPEAAAAEPPAPAVPRRKDPAAFDIPEANMSDRIHNILLHCPGTTLDQLAEVLYESSDTKSKHKVRSLLHFLGVKNRVRVVSPGVWEAVA